MKIKDEHQIYICWLIIIVCMKLYLIPADMLNLLAQFAGIWIFSRLASHIITSVIWLRILFLLKSTLTPVHIGNFDYRKWTENDELESDKKKKIFSRYYWYDQLLSHLYFFRGYPVGNFPYIVKTGKETETLEYHDGSTTYHWSIHFQSIWFVVALVRT